MGQEAPSSATEGEERQFENVERIAFRAEELGEEANVDLAKVIADGGLEALDKATLDDLKQVANETGIDLANIQAISDSLGGLDTQQLADMNAYLEESLEGELLEDINAEIAAISDIEGGMEALMSFNSYEDCVNGGGGAVCDQIDERLNELEGEE